jgi:uncharacterized protein (TIGR03437 family)
MRRTAIAGGLLVFCALALYGQPQIDGITNAADYTLTLAPGGIASIFGAGFAASPAASTTFPLQTTLNTVSVNVSGRAAPLFYVSGTQINFQVPYATAAGIASVTVKVGTQQSSAAQMVVAAFSPGFFQYGAGRGVIQNHDYSLNSATNPAPGGTFIIAYLTGIGAASGNVADGVASPSPAVQFPGTATATIGDANAKVDFLGLTPGTAGLAQANIEVPNLPSGDYPLVLSLNGLQNVSALVSISGSGSSSLVPNLLTLVSSFSLPGVGQTTVPGISGIVSNSLALYNNTLYVCSAADIKVVDVTNPVTPKFLSKISDSGFSNSAHNCTVNTLATKPFLADLVRASQSVAIYDLSSPAAPVKKSQNSIPLVPRSVAFQGNTAFFGEDLFSHSGSNVDSTEGKIVSVDYSNASSPANGPLVQSSGAHPETNSGNLRPYMIVPAPNLLYVASTTASQNFDSGVGALDLFDITNPKSIQGAGQFLVPGSKVLLTLAIQGSELLVMGDTRGFSPGKTLAGGTTDFPFAGFLTMTMFDISDPNHPKMQGNVIVNSMQPGNVGGPISLGSVPIGGGFYVVTCAAPDLMADGGSGNGSLVIVDGRDPQNPKAYTYSTLPGLGGLSVANGYLYAGVGSGGNVYRIHLP